MGVNGDSCTDFELVGSFEHKASKALLLAAVIAELVVLSELELLVVFGNWLAGVFMLSKQTSQITRVFFVLDERIFVLKKTLRLCFQYICSSRVINYVFCVRK